MLRMEIAEPFRNAFRGIVEFSPLLLAAVVAFLAGGWIIRSVKRRIKARVLERSGEGLTAEFIADLAGAGLYLLLVVFCLGILGFDSLTSKILAGAGLTTFIIGFALKDIGENFLSGIVMVFNRPFRTNDVIEIGGMVGRVVHMSLRETVLKTFDGKDLYIPNANILKTPLYNYTIDDVLVGTFTLDLKSHGDLRALIRDIEQAITDTQEVLKSPPPSVEIDRFEGDLVHLRVSYWYSLRGTRQVNSALRTEVMLRVNERVHTPDAHT